MLVADEDISVAPGFTIEDSSQDMVDATNRTNISRKMSAIRLDVNREPESEVECLAGQMVSMDTYDDAESYLNHRQTKANILTGINLDLWEQDQRFKRYEDDSKSREMDDLYQSLTCDMGKWYNLEEFFESVYILPDLWHDGYHLEELFRLDLDPFGEQDINQNSLMEVVRKKKHNILYTLFKKDRSYSVEKRKRSPEDETVNKMRTG